MSLRAGGGWAVRLALTAVLAALAAGTAGCTSGSGKPSASDGRSDVYFDLRTKPTREQFRYPEGSDSLNLGPHEVTVDLPGGKQLRVSAAAIISDGSSVAAGRAHAQPSSLSIRLPRTSAQDAQAEVRHAADVLGLTDENVADAMRAVGTDAQFGANLTSVHGPDSDYLSQDLTIRRVESNDGVVLVYEWSWLALGAPPLPEVSSAPSSAPPGQP